MLAGTAKLDSPDLRLRLRHEFSKPAYKQRTVSRPEPRLFADITRRLPKAPRVQLELTVPKAPAATNLPAPMASEESGMSTKPAFTAKPALPRQSSSTLLMRNVVQPKSKAQKSWKQGKLRLATATAIAILIGGGAFITFNGWRANQAVQAQAAHLTQQANSKNSSSQGALSTIKPNLASYTVAPDMPRYIMIPKLSVKARVLSVGVTSSGALATPNDVFDTAWYNESSLPGQPGAMLIDGHVSSWTTNGVFYGIKTLATGDAIQVQRGDGTVFNYKVVKTQIYSAKSVDMTAAMTPIVAGKPGLNLITCTGDVIPGTNEFNERVVVFAEQV